MTTPALRRSVLYVPGSNARALAKAPGLDADVVILDLEDGVAPAAKADARRAIEAALASPFRAGERLVRVNGLDTPWGADELAWAATQPIDGVVLPKVESATVVRQAEAILRATPLALWCLIETPRGVLAVEGIAAASARLTALVVGTNDLTKALRAEHVPSRAPLWHALSRVVLAARAFGLDAIDGVHLALDDDAGFEQSSRESRALGFDGRSLVHPRTISIANRVYGPSAEEVAAAERLIAAYRAAEARGEGVVAHEGAMVERLHAEVAERIVALAQQAAARAGGAR